MGVRDKEDLKKQKSKDVPLLMEELKLKYRGITIHKNIKCNTWYTRFRSNGKQQYISAKTQQECYNKLKKALKNNNSTNEKIAFNKTMSLNQWFNKWLELYKIGKVKDTTLLDYKIIFKNIPQDIKDLPLNQINVSTILNVLNNMSAERQKQKLYELLKIVFQKAEDNEIIDKNIIKRIERPRHTKKNSNALTYNQEQELINASSKLKNGDLFLISLFQGLRKGEVLGLTIDNLNFDKKTITIDKGFNKYNEFDSTKNEQSKRTMPMFEKTKDILIKYKNAKNRIFDISNKQLQLLMKEIKTKLTFDFKLKDLRATFITRCKENEIPEFVIQSWVGHKIGSKITSQVYTKHNDDIDDKYINILNKSKFYSNSTHKKN